MIDKKKLVFLRRSVQIFSFLLITFIIWTTRYPLPEGFINSLIYFRFDPFVMVLTSISEKVLLAGLLTASFSLLLAFLLGRVFCGWLCPLGITIDFAGWFFSIFKRRKAEIHKDSRARYFKFILLGIFAVPALFGIQLAWIFDPIAIFARSASFTINPFINRLINGFFEFTIKTTNYSDFFTNLYQQFKENILSLNTPLFPHTGLIFLLFLSLLLLTLLRKRFWCRYLCPLGAMLALPARYSPFKRRVYSCAGSCVTCKNICRMNAIKDDNSYRKEECILCLDCLVYCSNQKTVFSFKRRQDNALPARVNKENTGGTISRKQFLLFLGTSVIFPAGLQNKRERKTIRPPASLPEKEFMQRCIRCGNCMKACMTNVLQPALLESGLGGIWTPYLNTQIGYCEYKCNVCGHVCPTGAIAPLTVEQKMKTKLGLAAINRDLCLPWASGKECLVCEEHCPVSDKAIKIIERNNGEGKTVKLPYVEKNLCVGCCICEHTCPVRPYRAITVNPL